MKLVTIKNKFIFKPGSKSKKKYKPEQAHIYAAYRDKKSKQTRLIQMTHVIEPRKQADLKKGNLLMVKLPNVDMPSGVRNQYYTKDISGAPIDLKKMEAKNIETKSGKATYVSKPLAKKIVGFAKKEHKEKETT